MVYKGPCAAFEEAPAAAFEEAPAAAFEAFEEAGMGFLGLMCSPDLDTPLLPLQGHGLHHGARLVAAQGRTHVV